MVNGYMQHSEPGAPYKLLTHHFYTYNFGKFRCRRNEKGMQFCQKSNVDSPDMPREFLQEVLHLSPYVQRYMGEKFEEAA